MNRSDSQAFPRPTSQDPTGKYPAQDGATLREYLTGQALIGVLMLNAHDLPVDYRLMASHAVALADLTLIALADVTHADAVVRIAETHADPFMRVEDRAQTEEDKEEPGAAKKPAADAANSNAKKSSKTKT